MEQKYKKLFSDTLLFTISSFGSKILVFFMLPLYTSVLSSEDYGVADLVSSTVNLLYPILTLSICEATLRFALGKNVNKHSVFSNSLIMILAATVFLLLATPFTGFFKGTFVHSYWWYFVVTFVTVAMQTCISNYVKGCNKTKIFAIQGILSTVVLIACNIIFLLYLKIGLQGYLLAIIIAHIISIIYMLVASKAWKEIIKPSVDRKLLKEMLQYSSPMVLTTVAWWINASADKYMLVGLIGLSANGLYAVAHKVPSIFTTVTNLFSQAWRISAISDYEQSDKVTAGRFYSTVYKKYALICIYACAAVTLLSQLLAKILFRAEYYDAWKLIPPLLLAALFEAYSGFLASIYAAAKNTHLLSTSTCVGAVVNIVLNYCLIKTVGSIGAPVATFLSFVVVWSIRSVVLNKHITVSIDYRRFVPSLLLLTVASMYFLIDGAYKYIAYICCIFAIVAINFGQTKELIIFPLKTVKEFLNKSLKKKG